MKMTRRQMLLAGLGMLVTGCAAPSPPMSRRPRADWPGDISAPRSPRGQSVATPAPAAPAPATDDALAGLDVIARERWATRGAVAGRVNRMGGINRITVHHEGWTEVHFTDYHRTARRIEHDRMVHVDHRGWGDIGYHFIIDRAGRVWEGRSLAFQGAHVSQQNEHNIGVMCLGNFDKQQPSQAQMRALVNTLRTLSRAYNVSASRIYTHQELSPSACPGASLQPRLVQLRRSGRLG